MGKIISLDQNQYFDYESAVDEVEVLIPKYLDALDLLESVDNFEDIPHLLQNVEAYWQRISTLLKQVESIEDDASFCEAILNTQKSELMVLEKLYLKVNERIHFSQAHWTKAMWKAAEDLLSRIDVLLEAMGFEEGHDDRVLIMEVKRNNYIKEGKDFRSHLA